MDNAKRIEEIDAEIAKLKTQYDLVEGTKTEVWTRIVGYYRNVNLWNPGKREEFDYRKNFQVPVANENM